MRLSNMLLLLPSKWMWIRAFRRTLAPRARTRRTMIALGIRRSATWTRLWPSGPMTISNIKQLLLQKSTSYSINMKAGQRSRSTCSRRSIRRPMKKNQTPYKSYKNQKISRCSRRLLKISTITQRYWNNPRGAQSKLRSQTALMNLLWTFQGSNLIWMRLNRNKIKQSCKTHKMQIIPINWCWITSNWRMTGPNRPWTSSMKMLKLPTGCRSQECHQIKHNIDQFTTSHSTMVEAPIPFNLRALWLHQNTKKTFEVRVPPILLWCWFLKLNWPTTTVEPRRCRRIKHNKQLKCSQERSKASMWRSRQAILFISILGQVVREVELNLINQSRIRRSIRASMKCMKRACIHNYYNNNMLKPLRFRSAFLLSHAEKEPVSMCALTQRQLIAQRLQNSQIVVKMTLVLQENSIDSWTSCQLRKLLRSTSQARIHCR